MKEVKASILVSIFKRKGGEGQFTKILSENELSKELGFVNFGKDEVAVILYHKSDSDWFLISNQKVRSCQGGNTMTLSIEELGEVTLAIEEEYQNGIRNKNDFCKMWISDKKGGRNLVSIENGLPYYGVYQVLHFLASKS